MSAITYTVIVFISCVGHRFVFGVAAASRNTRFQAARYDLTWVGLAPADLASSAWRLHSFDHLVGGSEQLVWHREAEHPGRLVIDDQFELARLLDRQVRGFGVLEDTTGVDTNLTIGIRDIGRVAHQPTAVGKLTARINRGDREARCQLNQLDAPESEQLFGADVEGVGPAARKT